MNTPKLSIGMPVYNGEPWIGWSLQSVLDQTYRDFELLVSDNASDDNTADICTDFAAQDSRIKYSRNAHNIGVFRNFDLVFERSSGKYFKWWTVGDLYANSYFQKCVEILDSRPDVALVNSKTVLFSTSVESGFDYEESLELIDEDPCRRFCQYLARSQLNTSLHGVIRSDLLRQTSLNQAYASSDIAMIADLSLRGKFVEIPERLYFRREQNETSTAEMSPQDLKEFFSNELSDVMRNQSIKLESGLFRAISCAPVPFRKKMRLWSFIVKRIYWNRGALLKDIRSLLCRKKERIS
jgi:glycosyltransferase involved in cell wall biosynthesis